MFASLKRLAGAALLGVSLITVAAYDAAAAEAKFTIVHANDIDTIEGPKPRGGFSRLAAIIKAEKAKGGAVIYTNAGDNISPSLMSGFDKGAHVVELLNMVPPDIYVPGNHEYDHGPEVFRQRMAELKVGQKLAANLREADGKMLPGFADTKIMDINGVKVGFIGATADDAYVKSSPGDLKIDDAMKAAAAQARVLREAGADFIIVVAHANRGVDRVMLQSGIFDLILTGDDHDLLLNFDGRTAMMESREQAELVAIVDVTVKTDVRDGRKTMSFVPNFRVIDSASVDPDPQTEAKIEEYRKELSRELDVEIARIEQPLDSRRPAVRLGEAAIGNLIADGMRAATGADVAITNGGGIRANKQYVVGAPFTRRDVLSELPFGNRTILLELSGETILAALENGVSDIEQEGGRFPQISGMTVVADKTKPAGSRIVSVMVGSEALDPKKTYKLATNDFMLRGGDGYRMFGRGKQILGERDAKLMANDVMAFVRQRGKVDAKVEGRLTFK